MIAEDKMKKEITKDYLTQGDISKTLISLALPIMATSFIEMTYNLIDMIWIGKIGGAEVSAVGTAGFFIWILMSIGMITRVGAEVFVSQTFGRHDEENRMRYIESSLQLGFVIVLIYVVSVFVFAENLIDFFKMESQYIVQQAVNYLRTVIVFMVFLKMNFVMTGIFNAHGNSKTPFILNTLGMIANMILDPILIFGFGFIPPMGVIGAALATGLSHVFVSFGFIYAVSKDLNFIGVNPFKSVSMHHIVKIFKKGLPVGMQSLMMASISMVLARIVSVYNVLAVGVQRVTGTIESISWRSAGGFGSALTAFIGQNYGAKKWDRIKKSYLIGIKYVSYIGVFSSVAFIFFSEPIMRLFFYEPEIIDIGKVCLKIMGFSQIFMNVEIVTTSAFSGIGRTNLPSIISIVFNVLRVPIALILAGSMAMGLNGIWYSISITANLKGILIGGIFIIQYYVLNRAFKEQK